MACCKVCSASSMLIRSNSAPAAPSLTWRELLHFYRRLADSPRIHSRVLLTNCDELPAVLNDRHGFFCIRGADLDRMGRRRLSRHRSLAGRRRLHSAEENSAAAPAEALTPLLPALANAQPRFRHPWLVARAKRSLHCGLQRMIARASSPAGLQRRPPPPGSRPTTVAGLAAADPARMAVRNQPAPTLPNLCVCSDPTV